MNTNDSANRCDVCKQGADYIVSMNGMDLYIATIINYQGGCWATVRVIKTLYDLESQPYTPGMEFDIKLEMYQIRDVQA